MSRNKNALKLAFEAYVRQIRIAKRYFIPGLLLPGIGTAFTSYLPPLIIANMVTHFNGKIPSDLKELTPFLLVFSGVWILGEVFWRIAFLSLNRGDSRAMANLHIEAMDTLLQKDARFFSDNFAGSLTKKAIGYAKNFESFADTLSFSVFGAMLPLLFAGFILWRFSPWLVVLLFGSIATAILFIMPLTRRRQHMVSLREQASNTLAGYIADIIGNASTVRAFGREQDEKKQHAVLTKDYTNKAQISWDYHTIKIDGFVAVPLNILINVVGFIFAVTLTDTAVSFATVFVTFNYFMQASRVLFEFTRTYRNIENSLTEAAQFTELTLESPRITDIKSAKKLNVTSGTVAFKNVLFTHAESSDALFRELNLVIASGEKVGIIGRSGAGKSTITNLLLRFMDVDQGSIEVDGQNIAEVTQESLRKNIAYVAQESVLFHRSLEDNIRYGKLDSTDSEIRKAASLAHAHEFITQLPHKYETLVGERGVKLSGGQRQRIAIARAILKDAPILVLDEATSALDSESEVLIQDALNKLVEGRTTIVIAHRLSTIQKMDRIIVLDNGSVVEEGSHIHLLKNKGTYAKLWAHQSGGFLEE